MFLKRSDFKRSLLSPQPAHRNVEEPRSRTTPTVMTETAAIPESDYEDDDSVPNSQPAPKKRRIEPKDLPPSLRALANGAADD
jgi:hypothetical protein